MFIGLQDRMYKIQFPQSCAEGTFALQDGVPLVAVNATLHPALQNQPMESRKGWDNVSSVPPMVGQGYQVWHHVWSAVCHWGLHSDVGCMAVFVVHRHHNSEELGCAPGVSYGEIS